MSQKKHPADTSKVVLSAGDVAEYLRQHSDFFNEHTDLLSELSLSQSSGNITSLLEKQVNVLRNKNQQLDDQLRELIEIAKQNEELSNKIRQLILLLLDAQDIKNFFSILHDNLLTIFHVEHVTVRLLSPTITVDPLIYKEFFVQNPEDMSLFDNMLDNRQVVCGQIEKKQCTWLFADEANNIASVLILPLIGPDWRGVLAMSSLDPERFQNGAGVNLLINMAETMSCILKRWIVES